MVVELSYVLPSRDTKLGFCADQKVQTDKCRKVTPQMVKNFLVPIPKENLS
jgi:hypothetical protein